MSDLTDLQAAITTKIAGSGISGTETNFVNADANGNMFINLRDGSGNETGTIANELNVSDSLNTSNGNQGALTVGTTAVLVAVSGTNLVNRKNATLYNNSTVVMYWGYTNAVTISTGTPIVPSQMAFWDAGPAANIYIIAGTAGNNARITEGA